MLPAVDAEGVMREAIALTRSTHPHPNPRVAAIILTPEGEVVASGTHERPGGPHAERLAIADGDYTGHTMVVTLEPCNHTGLTPPCTEAIIDSGIDRVVVGAHDPDPRVAGQGIAALRNAGIDVITDVASDLVELNDPGYFHHRRTGRAFVTLKLAATLDGQVGAADGTSQWITGTQAREDAHRLRGQHDAVMVGGGTALADDPSLTVRLDAWSGPQPRPVVVVGRRPLPTDLKLLGRDPIIYSDANGVDLSAMAADLPEHGILSVLVEGGPTLAGQLLEADVVDQIVWYVGGTLGAGVGIPAIRGTFKTLAEAVPIDIQSIELLGPDVKIVASVRRKGQE
jgi:diaminohydroxyphosphoribosylaminopyrimidine deaminase/5-amino-6-(5-phosphoribosylamino)uracil reductase